MNKNKKQVEEVLPNYYWLRTNGYGALCRCMYTYPDKFSHIKQKSKKGKSVDEWVIVAEQLEQEYGELPNAQWLRNSSFGGMLNWLNKYPEKFAHIKQKFIGGKRVAEWVRIAEKLADENGGVLPVPSLLCKNGYNGLYSSLLKNPDKFSHINCSSSYNTVEESIEIAEELEKKHGVLPNCQWLMNNGYAKIQHCFNSHTDRFSHIKRDKKFNTIDEWIKIAERLEKKHGQVPNSTWLNANGFSGLVRSIYVYPDKFAHIKREIKKGRTIEYHIKTAEELEKEHGELPNICWLMDNKFGGLRKCIYKYPEKFAHIKQQSKKGKLDGELLKEAKKLSIQFGEILPSQSWLKRNGYPSLCRRISKRPEVFKGMKQEYKNGFRIIGEK